MIETTTKPTNEDVNRLNDKRCRTVRGDYITLEYIEESILRFVSESRYNRWGKKQKYRNVNKGVRRVI